MYTVDMEFLAELLFELVLDSAMEGALSRRLPRWLRYICAGIVFLFFLGFPGVLLWIGISEHNAVVIVIALGIAVFFFTAMYMAYRRQKEGQ